MIEIATVLGIGIGVVLLALWGIWLICSKLMPMPHEAFCTCDVCRDEKIRETLRKKAWSRQQDEIKRAVEEVDHIS